MWKAGIRWKDWSRSGLQKLQEKSLCINYDALTRCGKSLCINYDALTRCGKSLCINYDALTSCGKSLCINYDALTSCGRKSSETWPCVSPEVSADRNSNNPPFRTGSSLVGSHAKSSTTCTSCLLVCFNAKASQSGCCCFCPRWFQG